MTAIKAVECLDVTALGHYEYKMKQANDYINGLKAYTSVSPFSYNEGQELIDEAVEKLCQSIKDGSLLSNKRCVMAPFVAV